MSVEHFNNTIVELIGISHGHKFRLIFNRITEPFFDQRIQGSPASCGG